MEKANEVMQKIANINKTKILSVVTNEDVEVFEFLKEDESDVYLVKQAKLLRLVGEIIEDGGAITMRVKTDLKYKTTRKGKEMWLNFFKLAGIRFGGGDYEFISAEEMEQAHSFDPEGNYIGAEEGVKYVHFDEL